VNRVANRSAGSFGGNVPFRIVSIEDPISPEGCRVEQQSSRSFVDTNPAFPGGQEAHLVFGDAANVEADIAGSGNHEAAVADHALSGLQLVLKNWPAGRQHDFTNAPHPGEQIDGTLARQDGSGNWLPVKADFHRSLGGPIRPAIQQPRFTVQFQDVVASQGRLQRDHASAANRAGAVVCSVRKSP